MIDFAPPAKRAAPTLAEVEGRMKLPGEGDHGGALSRPTTEAPRSAALAVNIPDPLASSIGERIGALGCRIEIGLELDSVLLERCRISIGGY
jgi:hypothetical protein